MVDISVILPVYNTEKYLSQCLQSIINQTLKDIEIICIDDGSTDNSLEILNKFAAQDSRITVLTQPNLGAGAARNAVLKIANGKYLSFLDADDFFEPNMLELAYNACEKNGAQICVFRSKRYHQDSNSYEEIPWTLKTKYLPKHSPFSGKDIAKYSFQIFNGWAWDKLYLHEFIKQSAIKFQEQRTTNDAFFVFMHNMLADKIVTLDDVLAYHRVDVKDTLSVTREKSWDCAYNAILKIKSEMKNRQIYNKFEQSFVNWGLHFILWNINTMKDGKEKSKFIKLANDKYFKEIGVDRFEKSYFHYKNEFLEYKYLQSGKSSKFIYVISKAIIYFSENSFLSFIKKIINVIKYRRV